MAAVAIVEFLLSPATESGEPTSLGYLRHFPLLGRGFPVTFSNWFLRSIGFFREESKTNYLRDWLYSAFGSPAEAGGRGARPAIPRRLLRGRRGAGLCEAGRGRKEEDGGGGGGRARRLRRRRSSHSSPRPGRMRACAAAAAAAAARAE